MMQLGRPSLTVVLLFILLLVVNCTKQEGWAEEGWALWHGTGESDVKRNYEHRAAFDTREACVSAVDVEARKLGLGSGRPYNDRALRLLDTRLVERNDPRHTAWECVRAGIDPNKVGGK